jgi:dienelactone hydrolase
MRRMLLAIVVVLSASPALADGRFTGPWDLGALRAEPAATWGEAAGLVREVFYDNVPLAGKATRVFGYYARPMEGNGPFPAMVLIHGGGGKAFKEWATLWAGRGYVALAMDLSGRGPDGKRLPDGGPEQSDDSKFRDFAPAEADQMWTYHAVAAAIRGHSLLAGRPEVDKDRIGVTGISWGGYLTCIVAGIDDRVKVAVPVYGCGFLDENSYWIDRFKTMGSERTKRWADLFDPSRYLAGVTCPILFVNGTNDFAYPLDSYQKSYRLVTRAPVGLCIKVGMPHGHHQGWAPAEIGAFVDSILKRDAASKAGLPPYPSTPAVAGDSIEARLGGTDAPTLVAKLHVTTDAGPWQKRAWATSDAKIEGGVVSAKLPGGRPIAAFFTIEEPSGLVVSSPHLSLK